MTNLCLIQKEDEKSMTSLIIFIYHEVTHNLRKVRNMYTANIYSTTYKSHVFTVIENGECFVFFTS